MYMVEGYDKGVLVGRIIWDGVRLRAEGKMMNAILADTPYTFDPETDVDYNRDINPVGWMAHLCYKFNNPYFTISRLIQSTQTVGGQEPAHGISR